MSSSYRQILKRTSLIGGTSFIRIAVQTLQTKVIAVWLGPEGIGLVGVFNSLLSMVSSVVGLGLSGSGVRQIAEVAGQDDQHKLAETVIVFRRIIWFTGIVGILFFLLFAQKLSVWSFDSPEYAGQIIWLGIPLLFGALASGQGCLLQGTRRIADLSKIAVGASLGSTILVIPCYYFWRGQGIVPALIAGTAVNLAISFVYARKIKVRPMAVHAQRSWQIIKPMLLLGICFMISTTVSQLMLYLQKVMLIRLGSVEICGIYQAANSLSGILIGFVLSAMGTDYYPKLAGLLEKREALNKAVREQVEISVLLGVPGLAAMIYFAPFIIALFYSSAFNESVVLIQILALGMLGRVISWPLGYLVLAHGDGKIYIATEILSSVFWCGLFFIALKFFSVKAAACTMFFNYLLHSSTMILICKYRYEVLIRRQGYILWGKALFAISGMLLLSVFPATYWCRIAGFVFLGAISIYCLRQLLSSMHLSLAQLLRRVLHVGK